MLIHVIRTDNNFDYVKDYLLNNLIESKEIVKFKRNRVTTERGAK